MSMLTDGWRAYWMLRLAQRALRTANHPARRGQLRPPAPALPFHPTADLSRRTRAYRIGFRTAYLLRWFGPYGAICVLVPIAVGVLAAVL